MSDCDISTSGSISSQPFHVSEGFTYIMELPSKGYCHLMKAQRYGVWNVLKGLKPRYAAEKPYLEMISKEFSLMVGLIHPNIVRTYGLEQIPDWGTCIVMEFVDGRTLSDFIAENPSETIRKQVLFELLDAIAYFHKKQIVHQDLKPSNILITNDGNHVKIIDFGLSDSREYAILKEPAYTKAYAAPEQLSGGEIDNRTDLYAFGLILQQLFPKRYSGVAKKCLQPQREKRYDSAEVVIDAIKRTEVKRKWIPASLCVLLLLSGLVIFFIYYLKNHNNITENVVKERVIVQNLTKEDNFSAEKKGGTDFKAGLKNTNSDIQSGIADESEGQKLLDQYIYNLKFEFDSICKPLDKKLKEEKILYYEIFHNQQQIALLKMHIHIQKCRQLLPQEKQNSFVQYAQNLWGRYAAKYPSTDENGQISYPYYENLYRQGAISEEEYARLSIENEKGVAEIYRLSAQLKKETAKD